MSSGHTISSELALLYVEKHATSETTPEELFTMYITAAEKIHNCSYNTDSE